MDEFTTALERLKNDLATQGERVIDIVQRAVDAYFGCDARKAEKVAADDAVIDRADVEIERASIPLLAMGQTDEHEIRRVLTIVKINNELERIADCAVNIAEVIIVSPHQEHTRPDTFRMMANSVIGMLRDANVAFTTADMDLARRVLKFDDVVDRFKREIILDAEEQVAKGTFDVRFAFGLQRVTKALERIADHCTNICEQMIYLHTGRVVRHLPEGWSEPSLPGDA